MMTLECAFASIDRQITRLWRTMDIPPEAAQMSFNEYDYLKSIQVQGNPRLSEIASDLAVKKPSASTMVKRLEDKKLVKRSPCPNDGRATLISLTDKGTDLLSLDDIVYARLRKQIETKLGKHDAQEFQRLMSIICK